MVVPPWRRVPTTYAMTGLWVVYTCSYFGFFYVFQDAAEIADADLDGYLEVILLGVPVVVLLGAIVWLSESDAAERIRFRIVGWTTGMASVFLATMYTTLFVIEPRFDLGERWLVLLMSLGIGASAGSVTGISEIRSKMRERERDRTRELAMHKERQRSQLEHLNQYLRHEVLNEANKINGYATLVTQRVDDDRSADHLETIRRSSSEIADFIGSIREILAATDHDPELEPTDIVPVLEREAELIDAEYRSVAVDVDAPESASVLCGGLVRRIFRNLIENAIEHNDGVVSIGIDVTCGERWVTVRVRDDGSGIPGERRDDLFRPPTGGDHGYGLFLMRNLAEVYGGRLDLERTGPEGTEFAVRLRAESTRDGQRSPTRSAELTAPGR